MADTKPEPSPVEIAVVKLELETKMSAAVTKESTKEAQRSAIESLVADIYNKWSNQKRSPMISCIFNKDGTYTLEVK